MNWLGMMHTLGVAWGSVAAVRLADYYWPTEQPTKPNGYWFMMAIGTLIAVACRQ